MSNDSGSSGGSPMLKSFLSGGFGGVCLVAVGHPFDMIKVTLQTMPKPAPGEKPLYGGVMDCARKLVAREGVRGLYRGVAAPLVGITPIFAICFWGYQVGQDMVRSFSGKGSDDELALWEYGAAGAISAVPTTIIMGPGERLKCSLQFDAQRVEQGLAPKYTGTGDCVKKLYAEGGFRSLLRGSPATLLRDGPGSVAYFAGYEGLKQLLTPEGSTEMSVPAILFAGGVAGILNWVVSIPADVVKNRYQISDPGQYSGAVLGKNSVAKHLLAEEGIGALYKGVAPALLRAFPANAACFMGVESAKKFLTAIGL